MKNLQVEKFKPEVGDYVFATRWSDCDWNDPWAVGFVYEIGRNFVRVDDGNGGKLEDVGIRAFPCCQKISSEEGARLVNQYPELEGTHFDPEKAFAIFFGDQND